MSDDQSAVVKNIKITNSHFHSRRRAGAPHGRVDINDLMSRAREDEKKQKKENLVFFGVIASVIVLTGIIASL
jgi:hypothetical protein